MSSQLVLYVTGVVALLGCSPSTPQDQPRELSPSRLLKERAPVEDVWDSADFETVVVGDVLEYEAALAEKYTTMRVHHSGIWIADHHGSLFPVPGDFWWCSGETSDERFAGLETQHAGTNLEFRVEVDGILEGPGTYGWMNSCSHLLHVEHLRSITPVGTSDN